MRKYMAHLYYKRVVDGQIVQLHLHTEKEDGVYATIFSITEEYKLNFIIPEEELISIDFDEFRDIAREYNLLAFNGDPVPQRSA